jgi:hypothetical protein
MAWSTVTSPTGGTSVSTSTFGDPVAANMAAIGGAWTTDPRASSVIWKGATTDPVLNNGSIVSRYRDMGQTFDWKVKIVAGSTTTFGSGQWSLVPPFSIRDTGFAYAGYHVDSSLPARFSALFEASGTTSVLCWGVESTAGGSLRAVTSAVPFTWASGDIISVSMTVEKA